jgi:anti-sigma regulatory factor (Ser/Thr protein kinase)
MMGTSTREFDKSFEALAAVFEFLDESLEGTEVDHRSRNVLHLAVEELFTNMVKYNSGSSHDIAIRVFTRDDDVRVELIDSDTDPFNPLSADPVDIDRPIEQRQRGGLGLHLIRSMVDAMDYQYHGREMKVSVTTRLE